MEPLASSTPPHLGEGTYGEPARDVVGYAEAPLDPKWPGDAKVAVNIVLNYEEGGENCLLHGDGQSEHLLSEIVGATPYSHERHVNMESLYAFGSRSGFWRLHRILTERNTPVTVFAVGMALERNPSAAKAMLTAGWEIASHGYRWIDYQHVDPHTERDHIKKTVEIHERLLGHRPVGFYQGKPNVNTRGLVIKEGGFLYDADAYDDDLPYWTFEYGKPHLIVPYTLSENDMRFVIPNGFSHGRDFAQYLKDHLDRLVEEGRNGAPRMMSVGLHCRLVGRAGRAAGLVEFLDYAKERYGQDVWFCTREEIARHWYRNFWPEEYGPAPQEAIKSRPKTLPCNM